MPKPDYTEFDKVLLHAVAGGYNTMAQLDKHSRLRELAEPHRGNGGLFVDRVPTFRVIDRRLQALRKRGVIRFTGKAWVRAEKRNPI